MVFRVLKTMNEQRQSVIVKHDTKDQPTTDLWRDESGVHPVMAGMTLICQMCSSSLMPCQHRQHRHTGIRQRRHHSRGSRQRHHPRGFHHVFIIVNGIAKVLTVKRIVKVIVKIVQSEFVNIIFRCFIRFQHIWRAQLVGMERMELL